MTEKIDIILKNPKETPVTVIGAGISGLYAAKWLTKLGAEVKISELRALAELPKELIEQIAAENIFLETGHHSESIVLSSQLIVVSPGVPETIPVLKKAKSLDIPIIGEIELACRFIDIPIIAVTGTNGKSTVTSMIGEIVNVSGLNAFIGGNLGTPYTSVLFDKNFRPEIAVLEISSFQLDTTFSFKPKVGILLNITPDHLDRYYNFKDYIASKASMFKLQDKGDIAIINDDDEVSRGIPLPEGVTVLRYGRNYRPGLSAFISGDSVYTIDPVMKEWSIKPGEAIKGHNVENLMAAVLAAKAIGITESFIKKAVENFKGLHHRLEYVANWKGIDFYNDSKATNVDSAVKAVSGFDKQIILIAGGKHKGASYEKLALACKNKVKKAILLGEAKNLIANDLKNATEIMFVDSMEEAVKKATDIASAGDIVLLSPACSSFDMFDNYPHRGRVYCEAVKKIIND